MADIITLGGTFKTYSDLQRYCDTQFVALKSAVEKIQTLEKEVQHLQELLVASVPLVSNPIIVSHEQALLEAQINLIHQRALDKELTLEETKRLDLLIKNLNLIRGKPTGIYEGSSRKVTKDISDAELVRIASIEDKKNEN